MVDTKGLNRGDVLAALYNTSQPLGMGFLQFDPVVMTRDEAELLIKVRDADGCYFDYLKGRVMKVCLKDPAQFDERLYDRDNGPGAAERAIAKIRSNP